MPYCVECMNLNQIIVIQKQEEILSYRCIGATIDQQKRIGDVKDYLRGTPLHNPQAGQLVQHQDKLQVERLDNHQDSLEEDHRVAIRSEIEERLSEHFKMPITTHERNIAEKTLNIQGRDDDSDET